MLLQNNSSIQVSSKIENITLFYGEENDQKNKEFTFPNNYISTTKYTVLTFVPKSLLLQFLKLANIYFLVISILCFFPFSPFQPATQLGTLVFVLLVSMFKEAIEDYGRYKQDREVNNKSVEKLVGRRFEEVESWTLVPGDLIKVKNNEIFVTDTLIVNSSNLNGYCYIDTKSLDGETNLKEKLSVEAFKGLDNITSTALTGIIKCDSPNMNLNQFEGTIDNKRKTFTNKETGKVSIGVDALSIKNLILKGCKLKNTSSVIGIVVYTGPNTKIMKNSKNPRIKTSNLMKTMNKLIISMLVFLFGICFVMTLFTSNWQKDNKTPYLLNNLKTSNLDAEYFIQKFFTYLIEFSSLIPISLYIGLEIVKSLQKYVIKYDNEIFDYKLNQHSQCKASDLFEELGQVDFVFSDKTGTLTQNVMEFKKCFINGCYYGEPNINQLVKPKEFVFNINGDTTLPEKLKSHETPDEDKIPIMNFLYNLSLCHEVFPVKNSRGEISYEGSSQDEVSLVKGVRLLGIEFFSKDYNKLVIRNNLEAFESDYIVDYVIAFTSDRKMMSVVYYSEVKNQYVLFSKGADSVIIPKINFESQDDIVSVQAALQKYSKEGLRVLLMAGKILNKDYYERWKVKINQVQKDDPILNDLYFEIESNLTLHGCSGIEDKLQDGVEKAIPQILASNIKMWVLTGDKESTAAEIGKACKLINDNIELVSLSCQRKGDIAELLCEYIDKLNMFNIYRKSKELNIDEIVDFLKSQDIRDFSVIIDGVTLQEILDEVQFRKRFFLITLAAKSVICCRVSPIQKASAIKLVKSFGDWICLSIGDGANDVPMIMEANIGVGILGREGTQAARSSDFVISQFRFLSKLVLHHGRNGYTKISKFVLYYFYKNILLVFCQIIFTPYSAFSGQILFPDYLITMFNAFFTSWPCVCIFSFERDMKYEDSIRFPLVYKAGQKNYYFNLPKFWVYVFTAIIHSVFSYYIAVIGLSNHVGSSGNLASHWTISIVSFSLVIHITTYKIVLHTHYLNWFNVLILVSTIVFYYVCLIALSSESISMILQNEISGTFLNKVISDSRFWLIVSLGPILSILFDFTLRQIIFIVFPDPVEELIGFIEKKDKSLEEYDAYKGTGKAKSISIISKENLSYCDEYNINNEIVRIPKNTFDENGVKVIKLGNFSNSTGKDKKKNGFEIEELTFEDAYQDSHEILVMKNAGPFKTTKDSAKTIRGDRERLVDAILKDRTEVSNKKNFILENIKKSKTEVEVEVIESSKKRKVVSFNANFSSPVTKAKEEPYLECYKDKKILAFSAEYPNTRCMRIEIDKISSPTMIRRNIVEEIIISPSRQKQKKKIKPKNSNTAADLEIVDFPKEQSNQSINDYLQSYNKKGTSELKSCLKNSHIMKSDKSLDVETLRYENEKQEEAVNLDTYVSHPAPTSDIDI